MSGIDLLLDALAADLWALGVARTTGDQAGHDAGTPPLWVAPPDGVPAPGEKQGVEDDRHTVLGLLHGGAIAPTFMDPLAHTVVDLWVRCKGDKPSRRAYQVHAAVRDAWADARNHVLADGRPEQLRVASIDVYRPEQPLPNLPSGQGVALIASYVIDHYR